MNISNFINHLIALFKRLALIMLILTITRLIFLLFNWGYYYPLSYAETFKAFFFGLRFDFIVVFYLNAPYIIIHLVLFPLINKSLIQKILKVIFVTTSALLLFFNFIDIKYFGYTSKRSGWELIEMLYTSSDTASLIPQYLVNFWYLFLLLIVSVFAIVSYYPRIKPYNLISAKQKPYYWVLLYSLALIIFSGGVLFARGLDTKPVRIITANKYVSPRYIPLLLNTPFTIINTINQHSEKLDDFFPLDTLDAIYSPVHSYYDGGKFKSRNVVIIILESFGKEYIEAKNPEGLSYTPFLDSLIAQGLYCSNAYANAYRSMDAMPPILGGFPSLLRTSFLSSAYSINHVRGLPEILKEYGYQSAFFHGGHNGTMGFDMFCASVGFDQYFGRNEYNNDKDLDGGWGIWDEPFFQFMAQKVNEFKQPFLSVLFTLSSHDPYPIPEKYKKTLFPGNAKIYRSIAYTDLALRKFFETASHMDWYKNTLFVLCPDHTSIALNPDYKTRTGRVSIPVIYYCPGDNALRGTYKEVTQHLDIIPTILDYLNYPHSFTSFGNSIFSKGYRFSVCFDDVNFQIIDSAYCMLFDGSKSISLNNIKTDKLLKEDLLGTDPVIQNSLETELKAYLQNYYIRLNTDRLSDTLKISQENR